MIKKVAGFELRANQGEVKEESGEDDISESNSGSGSEEGEEKPAKEGEGEEEKKKGKFDPFAGMTKKERKEKVKQEKREKRLSKVPKHIKKRGEKKSQHPH